MRAILTPRTAAPLAAVLALTPVLAACGDSGPAAGGDGPRVVVTTSILGDIAAEVAGGEVDVQVLMPRGADPHEAALSAREADALSAADLAVVNGAAFEQAMEDTITVVEEDGTPVFRATDHVELLTFADQHAHEDEAEAGHAEEEGDELDHGHDEDEADPHFWTDPTRTAQVAQALGDRIAELDGVDADAVAAATSDYVATLEALDTEVEEDLGAVPEDRRLLVTNHEVFGYFADRYGFEVVGTVIPAGTTQAEPSAAEVEALAEVIEETGVPAVFAETSSPTTLADALADTVGDVEVVSLFSESLGDEGSGGATYVEMTRTNAERIAEALA
jgi:zinc/manganese transport system substrate-binding protein